MEAAINPPEALVEYAGELYIIIIKTKFTVTLRSVRDKALKVVCPPDSHLLRPYVKN